MKDIENHIIIEDLYELRTRLCKKCLKPVNNCICDDDKED